jgi:hypothetical protein
MYKYTGSKRLCPNYFSESHSVLPSVSCFSKETVYLPSVYHKDVTGLYAIVYAHTSYRVQAEIHNCIGKHPLHPKSRSA